MLTVQQAAEELNVAPNAIYKALLEGRLPYQEVFGRKVITYTDLEAYKKRTRVSGEKPKGRPKGSTNRKKEADGEIEASEQVE